MQKAPLISIIIPFYNTESSFFNELLEVLKKKNDNIECIIVNDGSDMDLSNSVKDACRLSNFEYFEYYPNQGVSHARNIGISKATGKYILFVDSDDLIDINLLNKISLFDLKEDLYLFKDCLILDKVPLLKNADIQILKIDDTLLEMFSKNNLKLSMRSSCNKLLMRSILVDNDIRFNEDLKFYEDSLFISLFIKKCDTFCAFDNILYLYRIYNNSSSRRYNKNYMEKYQLYFTEFKNINSEPDMLKGLYRDTIKNVLVDKTILDFKKFKFIHMFKLAKYDCIFESSTHLLNDENKFIRKLSNSINKKHFFVATNRIIFHQIKLYSLFLLNKIFRKSNI